MLRGAPNRPEPTLTLTLRNPNPNAKPKPPINSRRPGVRWAGLKIGAVGAAATDLNVFWARIKWTVPGQNYQRPS